MATSNIRSSLDGNKFRVFEKSAQTHTITFPGAYRGVVFVTTTNNERMGEWMVGVNGVGTFMTVSEVNKGSKISCSQSNNVLTFTLDASAQLTIGILSLTNNGGSITYS